MPRPAPVTIATFPVEQTQCVQTRAEDEPVAIADGKWSCAGEVGVALLAERRHPFAQVGRRGRERLEVAFELERVGEVGLEAGVEQPLREAERASVRRRACARARSPPRRARRPRRTCTRDRDRPRPAPTAPSPSISIALARQADEAGQQVRATRVGDEPPAVERPEKTGRRRDEHEVAREREVRARARRRHR